MSASNDHVVTVSTHNEGVAGFFDQSCALHGTTPVILGMGREWISYQTKLDIMREWVVNIPDDDVVLYLDRFDLVVVRPLQPLFQFYRDQCVQYKGRPVVYISTETFTEDEILGKFGTFQYGRYAGRILNTGSWLMTAKMLKAMLVEMQTPNAFPDTNLDDQAMITSYLCKHPEIIVELDDNRRFLVYGSMRLDIGAKLSIDPVTHTVTYNGYKPYVIHRNGGGYFPKILSKLGYDITNVNLQGGNVGRLFTYHVPNFCQKLVRRATSLIAPTHE